MYKRWLSIALVVTTVVLLFGVVSASAAPAESGTIHTVRRGETLSNIAQYYGVNMWDIARANGILNPNHIYVGQRLVIPTRPSGGFVHVVQRGETLTRIAVRYGVNVWAIARANGITNLNHIYVGQRLIIPGYGPPPPQPPFPPKPPPPQPPSGVVWPGPWQGEYFDNVALSGSPYLTRQDERINFDWNWGPPAGGMPTNNFSVRWTGSFHFDEGTYRFYAKVDDGVRVYVDGELIINGWRDGGTRTYSAARSLGTGDHSIQVDFYDRIQVARIYFWYQKIGGPVPTPVPTPGPTPPPSAGWLGEYFDNQNLGGSPAFTRYDGYIGFEWGTGSPAAGMRSDHFSIRWTTRAQFNTDHYRICAMSDDGARIWVGNELVLDEWHGNNGVAYCNVHWLASGTYDVRVEYYEDGGDALIYVWWEPN